MTHNRRQFLTTVAASAFCLSAPAFVRRGAWASGASPALHLPVIDATASGAFEIAATAGETEFVTGATSPTLGFNRPYLGPVIRVRPGSEVAASVVNRLDVPISVHWHGLLVSGELDGGPHQQIAPGAAWRPRLPIDQSPATLWYHTHIHGETAPRVYAGLAGVLIVDDGNDADRGLPSTFGVDDLVLLLQDKRFDASGAAVYRPGDADLMHGFLGEAVVVNGRIGPRFAVPRGLVRLRLVNGANARNFDLSFSDGRPFALVATDQGLLSKPLPLSRIRLTPGERIELLVDFGSGGEATLVSAPHAETGGTMAMGGMMHDMLPLPETFTAPFPVAAFAVDPSAPVAVRTAPTSLDVPDVPPPSPVATRRFVLNDMGAMMGGMGGGMGHGGHGAASTMAFGINGQPFDMSRLDAEAALGTAERWFVSGEMMGHPFHIHGARFRVLSENGGSPRAENAGWKDTVFVEGEAELLVRFDHPATDANPLMLHCHILEHEDLGMMGQFTVS
ncbi:MAG TPA: multicopper oxidase domain-containing protein [Bauldia sp.]|nr:multicopper oxidase domain-containing protein [Bauldia sp.]